MHSETYEITSDTDDYYTIRPDGGSLSTITDTELIISGENYLFNPRVVYAAWFSIDTTSFVIPTGFAITRVTFNVFTHNCTISANRGVTLPNKDYYAQMITDGIATALGTKTYSSQEFVSFELSKEQIANINSGGNTEFRISISAIDSGAKKLLEFRSREYFPSGDGAFLEVFFIPRLLFRGGGI